MKKGFDKRLASALQLDRETLFHGWRVRSPDDIAVVAVPDDNSADTAFAERQRLLDALGRMIPVLRNDGIKSLVEVARREIDKIADAVDDRMRREESGKPPVRK
jgi:hypothetical protein